MISPLFVLVRVTAFLVTFGFSVGLLSLAPNQQQASRVRSCKRVNAVPARVYRSTDHAPAFEPHRTRPNLANQPIRRIDFTKVAYPNYPDLESGERITLKAGDAWPSHLEYGDITGDGVEEAMVVLPEDSGKGTAIHYRIYVFGLEKGKLKLIWDFDTGDRADGGVRRVYADQGNLMVELFGQNRVVGDVSDSDVVGLCCPSSFTRTRYDWTGKRFQQTGTEVLPNVRGDAAPVMSDYDLPS